MIRKSLYEKSQKYPMKAREVKNKSKQKTFLSLRERGKEEFPFCLQGQRREGLRETNNPVTQGQIIRICLYRNFPLTLKVLPKYVGSKYNNQ